MQIEAIRLKNFRSFKDVTLRDIPRFCVPVGVKGAGKNVCGSQSMIGHLVCSLRSLQELTHA